MCTGPAGTGRYGTALDGYRTAARQLKQVRAILTALGPNWRASRDAFNELVRVTQPE